MESGNKFERFVVAQEPVYDQVIRELSAGRKQSHWMWFIFPQIAGLGKSERARYYALDSVLEAECYLQHALLGARLRQCTQLVLDVPNRSAREIFGQIDCLKFRSSMTLFSVTSLSGDLFERALEQYFAGIKDARTLRLLQETGL
jgi:uncharacterized protein (DUF1810 family)